MKKYELLNQLQQEREQAINTIAQLCDEWNLSTATNEIVINKGKVVEVPVVKEVVKYETKEIVVDNTDTETIEMLRETIRQMNQTINDINKEHDELYKLYLEEQREKVIWAAAHDELKDELEVKEAIIENLKAQNKALNEQLKEEKEKQPRVVYVEVADDHTYDNEPEPEEEVVNKVEEIIVPVTKEEKPVSNAPYSINIKTTHDAVKAEITVGDKVFYAAWSVAYNKPAYALVDNHKQYTRKDLRQIGLGIAYKYDKQIIADLKSYRDKLLEELEAKRNKNNNRKPEPQVTKENTIETPEEIEVPITNDTTNAQTNEESIETDDKWADIDNAEFF